MKGAIVHNVYPGQFDGISASFSMVLQSQVFRWYYSEFFDGITEPSFSMVLQRSGGFRNFWTGGGGGGDFF